MDELIIRSLQGLASPEEEERLSAWRQEASDHDARYQQVVAIWQLTASGARFVRRPMPSASDIIRRAEARAAPPEWRRRTTWRRWAVAAAAVLVAFLFLLRPWTSSDLRVAEISTAAGEVVSLRLSDGSLVELGPESRLRISGAHARRTLWLEGKAYFAAAERKTAPFVVRTRLGEARALGTRFEVRVENERLRVLVVEGRVALSAAQQRVELAASQMSIVQRGSAPVVVAVEDANSHIEWMTRTLVFHTTPLRQALSEVGRHYNANIILADSALARRTVTASFTDASFESVVTVLCRVVGASCVIGDRSAQVGTNRTTLDDTIVRRRSPAVPRR